MLQQLQHTREMLVRSYSSCSKPTTQQQQQQQQGQVV
jgi:hypothetical protein